MTAPSFVDVLVVAYVVCLGVLARTVGVLHSVRKELEEQRAEQRRSQADTLRRLSAEAKSQIELSRHVHRQGLKRSIGASRN